MNPVPTIAMFIDLASAMWQLLRNDRIPYRRNLPWTASICSRQRQSNFHHLVGFAQFGRRMGLPVDADRNQPKPTRPKPSPDNASPENSNGDPLPNSAADDFFVKMNRDFRRPKPSEEAVAAALHAIQTLPGDAGLEHDDVATEESSEDFEHRDAGQSCPKCAAINSGSNRFCGYCGTTLIRR